MDEITDIIVNLKSDSKILRTLIDTILDSCGLDYMEEDLSIRIDSKILTVLKTFYPDEYSNKLKTLKSKLVTVKECKEEEEEIKAPEVSGEEIQKNLVKLCKDNNLDLRQICKEYKINVNSTVEDLAAAYYALNNKILKGEV